MWNTDVSVTAVLISLYLACLPITSAVCMQPYASDSGDFLFAWHAFLKLFNLGLV